MNQWFGAHTKHVAPSSAKNVVKIQEHSANGLSTRLWGPIFWNTYLSLAANLHSLNEYHPNYISFFFRISFGSTGPCEHCCHSHRSFAYRSETNLDKLVIGPLWNDHDIHEIEDTPNDSLSTLLVRWIILLKYYVNTKLDKEMIPLELVEFSFTKETDFLNMWSFYFFNWLYCQALMFPLDVSLSKRQRSPAVAEKYRDFVHFFTQLKYILPRENEITEKWVKAYYHNPPSSRVFASRDQLFQWVYQMHRACIGKELDYSAEEIRTMFESMRSKSCSNHKHICM